MDSASEASTIAAGDHHTCAVLTEGSVLCWGLNSNGQLGTGDRVGAQQPTAVNLGTGPFVRNSRVYPQLFCIFVIDKDIAESV